MENYFCVGYRRKIKFDKIESKFGIERKISIVIPTYNEEENLENIVEEIIKNLKKTKFKNSYEIVVVDDDSKDKTPKIMDELARRGNFVALHRFGKRGLFSAVMDGIKIANGKYVLIMDADFSHPPKLIPEFTKYAGKYDIVSGSRFVKGGGNEEPFVRKIGTAILNKSCSIILGLRVKDLGGQFRLFDKEKFSKIKFKYDSKFAEYGMELFYRAKQERFRVKEIPFVYKFRESGKSKMGNLFEVILLGFKYIGRAFHLRFE
ncbi:MAG: glycosyltransferase [Candidatus Pacearchaeota archaeon]|nr:glycosyltransferase [Candidatus Pacearchaeota archaeon]